MNNKDDKSKTKSFNNKDLTYLNAVNFLTIIIHQVFEVELNDNMRK